MPSSDALLASQGAQATSFLETSAANRYQAAGPIAASATSAAPPVVTSMAAAARRLRNNSRWPTITMGVIFRAAATPKRPPARPARLASNDLQPAASSAASQIDHCPLPKQYSVGGHSARARVRRAIRLADGASPGVQIPSSEKASQTSATSEPAAQASAATRQGSQANGRTATVAVGG